MESRHLSRVISASASRVYEFAANPDNLPLWARGLAASTVERDGDLLWVSSPMGDVSIRFAPPNDLGVLDHDVTLPSGETVHNPLRVLPHPHGCEVVFTIRQGGATLVEFDRDCATVAADLERLQAVIEVG